MRISHSEPALPGRPAIGPQAGPRGWLCEFCIASLPALPGQPAIGPRLDPKAGYADFT